MELRLLCLSAHVAPGTVIEAQPSRCRLAILLLLSPLLVLGQTGKEAVPILSPIDLRITQARAKVKASPNSVSSYTELAAALCRKARATEDLSVYNQAEVALNHSLQISNDDYQARRWRVAILLGKHEYVPALQLATELNRKVPDDIEGWAALVDANLALGNYPDAARQAQQIFALRPESALGFEKSAGLRELSGDVPGAIEFLDEANRRTPASDTEQHAWLMTQKARLQFLSGDDRQAEMLVGQALQLSPGSLVASAVLAHMRMAESRFAEAATLFARRYAAVKSARNLFDWAAALERNGQKQEAQTAFQNFQAQAERLIDAPFNANLELVFFYLTEKHAPASALALAIKMSAARHDVSTLDAYAWALFHSGRLQDASVQMKRVLQVGVRDPFFFCHASQIAASTGDAAAAANFRKELATFKHADCVDDLKIEL